MVNLELQPTSYDIWSKKHRLSTYDGTFIDDSVNDMFWRVANALAVNEDDKEYWIQEFYNVMLRGCFPAGRILSNAGAEKYKPGTTLINCVVASNIEDSLDNILNVAYENGMTLKTGAGIGFCFSTIRPAKAFVNGVNAHTSGPLSFADIYDKTCFTISSAGGRRGSMMMTFAVTHPDVFEVIAAKREDGRLRQFNISLLITDEFITAVRKNLDWKLYFPLHKNEPQNDTFETLWAEWPIKNYPDYEYNEHGLVLCKVYKTVRALDLWNAIMRSNYDYSEPGFILIDKINRENNLWFIENIIATNP